MSDSPLTYLVIGHVCQDHTPFGLKWGGTAMFGAVTAFRLGVQVRVLTSTLPGAVREALPEGVAVHNIPTDVPLTFLHEYVHGQRVLSITATAPALRAEHLPPAWRTPDVVHFGPVAQEVGRDLIDVFDASLRGASVQGWMREWTTHNGLVMPLPAAQLLDWAPPVDCGFLSEEDIGDRREVLGFYRRYQPLVALTDGAHGATIFEGETSFHVPAVPAREVDANGAGDVFAAAFLIRYRETGSALIAARFAAAVASFHVEQVGIVGIPTRIQAEARYREFYGA